MNILGVDLGVRGGLAIIAIDANSAAPRLIDAIDIPAAGVGAKEPATAQRTSTRANL